MSTKRIMRAFKLAEISAVDRPAQVGAVVSIIKRDFSDAERKHLASTGAAMDDGSFPIKSATDLTNAVHDWGRAGSKPDVKAHIIARAKALGATDALPDGWVSKSAGDPNMSIKKALGLPETATDAEVTAAVEKANATTAAATLAKMAAETDLAKLKARLEKADMSDKHTAFMNNPKATMPKGGKAAFQAMEPAERDAHCSANPIGGGDDDAEKRFNAAVAAGVAKALAGEEVIKVGDVEIRKSVVGDAHFAVFKAQQTEITKERDARELLVFEKRAETEWPALPGEPVAKAKALRGLQKLDESDRKVVEAMLKSGNNALKQSFRELGKGGGGEDMPVDKIEALAKIYAKENKVTFEKAYSAVLDTDEGRELYAASRRAA